MMIIRTFLDTDLNLIQNVIDTAFHDEETKIISNVASELATETTNPEISSLIAQFNNKVIGCVSYSPIFFKSHSRFSGYILAPLAVCSKHQKQGVGSNPIKSGISILTKDGVGVLLVYGGPKYYGRFGFKEKIGRSFVPPYPLEYPFSWMGMMLNVSDLPNEPLKFECVTALSKPHLW